MPSTEYRIQTEVAQYMSLNYPQILVAVSPAAGFKVSAGLAMKMMRMGYQKGTPDLIILEPMGLYHGFLIELKTPTGVLSREQKIYLRLAAGRGYLTAVCRTAKDAITLINDYLNLPF